MKKILAAIVCAAFALCAAAQYEINYSAEFAGTAGSGDFAPYYMASNIHGVLTQKTNAQVRARMWRGIDAGKRFSYGFGADVIGGYASKTEYERYSADTKAWITHKEGPAAVWLQQLYGEVKYRSVFLTLGMKEHDSFLLNQSLSSGDITYSGNARPIPGFRTGFIDFQDIPFTNGWVQIEGVLEYGKQTDNKWVRDHYNYYNRLYNNGAWYHYKHIYFRTKPSQPLSVVAGIQTGSQFGGKNYSYSKGKLTGVNDESVEFDDFFRILIPTKDSNWRYGNYLGSIDLKARYRFRTEHQVMAYFQWPFEDGSGLAKCNGFDGLWGLEYKAPGRAIVNGAVLEYLDFTNQSGQIHWDPVDNGGTDMGQQATGSDDYYNNRQFNGYAYYGMSIGTPMLRSPLYNLNGSNYYMCNRVRGFHIGVSGNITSEIDYRLLGSYRKGWGTSGRPLLSPLECTSLMAECVYAPARVPGMVVNVQVAADRGSMYGDNFGVLVGIKYNGLLNF